MPLDRSSFRYILPAAVLFGAAAVLRFALVGYGILALCLAALGIFCLLLWRCHRRGARRCHRVLWGIFSLCLAVLTILEIPVIRDAHTDPQPQADYVIVLGAGINGTTPSLSLTDRLKAALDYLERYPESIAILSGGQGPDEAVTEAWCMYDWLTARGVAPARLLLEDASASTEENLRFSFALIHSQGRDINRVAIVSSEYHLHRAKKLARTLGCEQPLGVAAQTSLPLLRLNYFIREAGCALAG